MARCALYPVEAMALTAFFCSINIVFESAPQDIYSNLYEVKLKHYK